MSDPKSVTGAMMRALVTGAFGCLDAAVATIDARWGLGCSKGTLSRKMSGSLDWTIADVLALEDAAGRYPVTQHLARRMGAAEPGPVSLVEAAGLISRECGEAVSAILAAQMSAKASDRAEALREISEAIEVLDAARAALQAGEGA